MEDGFDDPEAYLGYLQDQYAKSQEDHCFSGSEYEYQDEDNDDDEQHLKENKKQIIEWLISLSDNNYKINNNHRIYELSANMMLRGSDGKVFSLGEWMRFIGFSDKEDFGDYILAFNSSKSKKIFLIDKAYSVPSDFPCYKLIDSGPISSDDNDKNYVEKENLPF